MYACTINIEVLRASILNGPEAIRSVLPRYRYYVEVEL